uniref:Src homology 2 domain containing F n=1 Tax=Chelonoidis abingdonii TaxID=106734 RepID=A0A8C0IZP7_CHEAB
LEKKIRLKGSLEAPGQPLPLYDTPYEPVPNGLPPDSEHPSCVRPRESRLPQDDDRPPEEYDQPWEWKKERISKAFAGEGGHGHLSPSREEKARTANRHVSGNPKTEPSPLVPWGDQPDGCQLSGAQQRDQQERLLSLPQVSVLGQAIGQGLPPLEVLGQDTGRERGCRISGWPGYCCVYQAASVPCVGRQQAQGCGRGGEARLLFPFPVMLSLPFAGSCPQGGAVSEWLGAWRHMRAVLSAHGSVSFRESCCFMPAGWAFLHGYHQRHLVTPAL